jgi:tRNA1(Val) A37 N6-methylase TrmN6
MLNGRLVNGRVEIPVVVNVLYNTAAENISLTQIQSQIDVLNADFNATNSDFNSTALFSELLLM